MKHATKSFLLTSGLFLLGILVSSPFLSITEAILGRTIASVSVEESLTFDLSVALLMALSVPAAELVYWAYTRSRPVKSPILVFGITLIISLISAFAAIILRIVVLARLLSDSLDLHPETILRLQSLAFLPWGVMGMFLACGSASAILLLMHPSKPSVAKQ